MDLVALINDALPSKRKKETRHYVGASSIGRKCDRAIWYSYNNVPCSETPATLQRIFDIGHNLEHLLLEYVEMTGIELEVPSESNNMLFVQDKSVPIFQGHMDGILKLHGDPWAVLELKTANNSNFSIFKKTNLREWSESYFYQIQAYMGMSGLKNSVVLAINKDNAELHHEWIHFDECAYELLKRRASHISESHEPPEKINRSPLFITCKRCQFKEICHGN